ncbi:MAG: geobacillin-26 family protein [Anaerorhabdus sp.]|uniref:geobacillin-26 family protein n=1 Tax=Anaerorhabdus sp. TaxID=1872524 RepID=UPI002FC6871D
MSIKKKITVLSLASIMGLSFASSNISNVKAAETTIVDKETGFEYTLLKDDESERIIHYYEENSEITLAYNKKENTMTVTRILDGETFVEVIKPQTAMARGNSSMFSPWKYSNSGSKYTLTAVINGKTKSKTVTKNSTTSGNINRFCDAVDDVRGAEWSIIIQLGPVAAGGLLFAALTGGVGIPAALAALGASASALKVGNDMNTYYARARSAYNAL